MRIKPKYGRFKIFKIYSNKAKHLLKTAKFPQFELKKDKFPSLL